MIETYLQQLKSKDVTQRREAIIALGKSSDPAALQPLADIYRNDPEPALRDLALKAGRYLRQHMSQGGGAAGRASAVSATASNRLKEELSHYESEQPAATPKKLPLRRVVSPDEVTRSKSYVDDALSHNMNGDNARALKSLRKALELNPNIMDDGFFVSVAGAVTGTSGQAAIDFILDQEQAKAFVKESMRQQKSVQTAMHLETAEQSHWSGVTLELIIFMLINVLGTVIIFVVFSESIANLPLDSETLSLSQANELRSMMSSVTIMSGVILGVVSAIWSAASLFVQGAAIHLVATMIFQGKGTMRYMLDKLFGLYNKQLPLLYALSIASVWITFSAGSPIFTGLLGLVTAIIGFRILFKASSLTSEAYNFGAGSGCLTNVVAFGILWLITAVIGFVFGNVVMGALFSGMGNLPLP